VWLTREESKELNCCQYLDRAGIEEGAIRSQPISWKTDNGETSVSRLPQIPEIAGRSNIAKTTNIRAGNSRVQLGKRAANAAPSTAPKRKAKMPRTKNGIGRQTVFGRGEV
jgi:hypothetical protein